MSGRRVSRTVFAVVSGLCVAVLAVVLVIWSPWDSDDRGGGDDIPASSPSPTVSETDGNFVEAEKLNRGILIFLYDDDDEDYEVTYDTDGYIVKITDEWEVFEFEYDFDAQTIKMNIDDDGRFGDEYEDIYIILEYDENGFIVSETEYHDGEKVWLVEYEYDENGSLTWERTTYYNEDGSVDEQYETHYDADGNIVE